MAAQVSKRKISPVELVQAHLDRIDRLNPKLNAFVRVDAVGALQQARAAEAAVLKNEALGPLHGVPISIKSSVELAGMPFETGSALRKGTVGAKDAPLVARLKAAGAIVLGSTNVPEMLMNYFTDNAIYGRTNSPFDLGRTPGGSSGGESAAIAACCSAAGIGSDGGGSVRVPAHYCGIYGLKPTPGRIPITGHYPTSGGPFASMGVVGPMARSAADLQVMFEATAGPDYLDPCSAPAPVRRVSEAELRKTRIGYFEDDGNTPVTPETARAVRAAADSLRQQGFSVEAFCPEGLLRMRELWWVFFGLCGAAVIEPMFVGREQEISAGLKEFLGTTKRGPQLTRDLLLNTWFERDGLRLQILQQMEEFPILLSPVCAIPAFRHGERSWMIGGKSVDYLQSMCYSQWINATGMPAASVPVGRSDDGLPIGVQVIGRPYEDEVVLAISAALERDFGWTKPAIQWDTAHG